MKTDKVFLIIVSAFLLALVIIFFYLFYPIISGDVSLVNGKYTSCFNVLGKWDLILDISALVLVGVAGIVGLVRGFKK